MPWRPFDALLPYFGSKRRLAARIFKEISRVHPRYSWSSLRLVDAFLGGGSISLYAKAQGFGVLCGDLAERSVLIGRGLIENDAVTLTEPDLLRLFVPMETNRHLIETNYVPDCFPPGPAQFLDNGFAVAEAVEDDTKSALLRLLLIKYLFWLRPHSKFSSPGAFNRPFAEERWDDIKSTYKHAIMANAAHPLRALRSLAKDINGAVMRGAQPCAVRKGDALETIRAGVGADILYLDPPYGGTLAYEEEYRVLDEILGDHLEVSAFSGKDGLDFLVSLLAECRDYPMWAISYGNSICDLTTVTAAIEQFRPVRAIEVKYQHMAAVATKEKRAANREFIILAGEMLR